VVFSTEATTVFQVLIEREVSIRGVAVAVNGSVVPKSEWSVAAIHDGDVVEIVTAAAGG
jgi:sulfur carrier protein